MLKTARQLVLVSGGKYDVCFVFWVLELTRPQQQTVELESSIDKSGNFSLDVQVGESYG